MGFRFRRSIKIFPGVRINLSKKRRLQHFHRPARRDRQYPRERRNARHPRYPRHGPLVADPPQQAGEPPYDRMPLLRPPHAQAVGALSPVRRPPRAGRPRSESKGPRRTGRIRARGPCAERKSTCRRCAERARRRRQSLLRRLPLHSLLPRPHPLPRLALTPAPRGLFSCRETGAKKEAQPMPRFPFRGASLLLPARPVRDARRQPPGQMRRERVPQGLPPFLFHTTSNEKPAPFPCGAGFPRLRAYRLTRLTALP